jgi:hypothetical protein
VEDFDDGVVHQLNAKHSEEEAVAAVRHIAHYELGSIQHMAAYLNHLVKHYNHNAAAAAAAAAAADSTVGLSNALAAAAAAAVAANSAAAVHASGVTMQQLLGATMLGGNGSLGSTVGGARGVGGAAAAAGLGAFGGQIRLASVPVSTKSMLQKLPLKVFKQIELLVQNCAYLEWRHFDGGVIKVRVSKSLSYPDPAAAVCNHIKCWDGAVPQTFNRQKMQALCWAGSCSSCVLSTQGSLCCSLRTQHLSVLTG